MISFMTLIAMLIFAASAFASEISEADVKIFLNEWLTSQNTGSYSNYAAMYSNSFIGIKRSGSSTTNLNHDAWLKDRKKMFKKMMVVAAKNLEIKLSETKASVKFEQKWESGTIKDKGDKLLNLTLENGKLIITREEMMFSKIVPEQIVKSDKARVVTEEITTIKNVNPTNSSFGMFTSIKEKDCKKLSKKLSTYFDNRRLERSECPAPKGWRLFTVVGGERYWIEIAYGSSIWSTEDEVVTKGENRFGDFQSIDFEQVEWRMKTTGELSALIFPVIAQDPDLTGQNLYRFFAIKITDNFPHFCGVAKTSHEARIIADKSTACTTTMPENELPM